VQVISLYSYRCISHIGSSFSTFFRCLIICFERFSTILCIIKSSFSCLYGRCFRNGHCSTSSDTPVVRHSHFNRVHCLINFGESSSSLSMKYTSVPVLSPLGLPGSTPPLATMIWFPFFPGQPFTSVPPAF
jgi:hypothetical protein